MLGAFALDFNLLVFLFSVLTSLCSNIVDVGSYSELKEAISLGKWARGPWSAR